jgi:hypothetical protein
MVRETDAPRVFLSPCLSLRSSAKTPAQFNEQRDSMTSLVGVGASSNGVGVVAEGLQTRLFRLRIPQGCARLVQTGQRRK